MYAIIYGKFFKKVMMINSIIQLKKLAGKCVLTRVDFNVPVKNGKIQDNYKIVKSLSTIEYLLKKDAKVILLSHFGRPKGMDKKLSLKPVVKVLEKMLKRKIKILNVDSWNRIETEIEKMKDGEIIMLENIRFLKGEEENNPALAKKFAGLADLFVLDGFAVSHRQAASVSGVAKLLPTYAGLLMAEEINGLSKLMEKPKKPFVVILGGAKMETKLPLLKKFLEKADYILLGGGLVNTYLWAQGKKIGGSIVEQSLKKEVLSYKNKKKIIWPVDLVVGQNNGQKAKVVKFKDVNIIDSKLAVYDIGPATIGLFSKYIKNAQTLIWNGAMGYFEQHPYQFGTYAVARLVASRAKGKAFGVCGGGETVEVIKRLKLIDDIDLVSTGGGAMLEFLSGNQLPGVKAVLKKKST